MKLLKWMLVAIVSAVLCVVCVFLVRKAVTPVQGVSRLSPSIASPHMPPGVSVATVANDKHSPREVVATPSPTPFVPPTPIGRLPAPAILAENTPKPTATPVASSSPSPSPAPALLFDPAVQKAQRWLAELGYPVGKADGKLGTRTESALEAFQREHALARTKKPDAATLAKLEEEVKRRAVALQAAQAASLTPTPNAKVTSTSTTGSRVAVTTTSLLSAGVIPTPKNPGEPQLIVVKGRTVDETLSDVPKLDNKADVKRLQSALAAAGFYKGEIDGRWGKESLSALNAFQRAQGLKATTKIDSDAWKRLVLAAGPTPTPLPDLLVVAPVSRVLKKVRLGEGIVWYTPAPQRLAPSLTGEKASGGTFAERREDAVPAVTTKVGTASAMSVSPTPSADSSAKELRSAGSGSSRPQSADQSLSPTPPPADAANVAHPARSENMAPAPGNVPTPAPVGSSLEVADAKRVEFAPNTVSRSAADVPMLLPRSPSDRGNGTYAEATIADTNKQDSRIETVARETDATRLLRGRPDQTTNSIAQPEDPSTLSESLRATARQLEQPAAKSKRELAAEKVQAVEGVFKELKRRFGGKFSSGAVAEQIASVEAGFKAMKEDFQKGSYDQILARGDGFKRAIEIVTAHAYVASMLSKPDVRAKIPQADLRAIETLRREAERNPERLDRQEKFIEAAALIQARASNASSTAAKANSASRSAKR
ncbi:MAG: peptidoglycan-binding protein [Candidatus Sumerlaeaceae bacterium]|nr:peptidoglycan-binding protein [Candidatus Sumerlaeaceae bacterium]